MGTLSPLRNQCVLASELMLMIEILYEAQIFPRDFSLMDLIDLNRYYNVMGMYAERC